jgi:hypothetical protein
MKGYIIKILASGFGSLSSCIQYALWRYCENHIDQIRRLASSSYQHQPINIQTDLEM